ncbi:MAG: hypothetical protein SF182_01795 [Deltaproteobacteria bacterium]|nr:hypothetical protein [Deltaproteobacteria bacterium]
MWLWVAGCLLLSSVTLAGEPLAPRVEIASPQSDAILADDALPFAVRGTIQLGASPLRSWELSVGLPGKSARRLAHGDTPVTDATLASLRLGNRLRLRPGLRYALTLDATDTDGRTAQSVAYFRISRIRFARVPVPDRFDQGGFNQAISRAGTRIVVERTGRDANNDLHNTVWLFDTTTRELRAVALGFTPALSGDGRQILFVPESAPGTRATLYNVDSERQQTIFRAFLPGTLNNDGTLFTSLVTFGTAEVPEAGRGVFVLDLDTQRTTRISQGPLPQYVDDLTVSSDGPYTAFSSATPLDPTATTGEQAQVFLYDDRSQSLRQVSNRQAPTARAYAPALSADGSTLVYRADDSRLLIVDLPHGAERTLLDVSSTGDYIDSYYLSDDGRFLGFTSSADLDPSVGNEDHSYQLFVMDIRSGGIQQATDVPGVGAFVAMDGHADTMILDVGGELQVGNETFYLNISRVVRRRPNNTPPALDTPLRMRTYQGRTTQLAFSAIDPDGDPITYFAQLKEAPETQLRQHFASVLDDHGNGIAQLTMTPDSDLVGTYHLLVAAFDDAGAVTARVTELTVEPVHDAGDGNCDGRVSADDVSALLPVLLNLAGLPDCIESADINGDSALTIADLVALSSRH